VSCASSQTDRGRNVWPSHCWLLSRELSLLESPVQTAQPSPFQNEPAYTQVGATTDENGEWIEQFFIIKFSRVRYQTLVSDCGHSSNSRRDKEGLILTKELHPWQVYASIENVLIRSRLSAPWQKRPLPVRPSHLQLWTVAIWRWGCRDCARQQLPRRGSVCPEFTLCD
jgi:hypothetical protein